MGIEHLFGMDGVTASTDPWASAHIEKTSQCKKRNERNSWKWGVCVWTKVLWGKFWQVLHWRIEAEFPLDPPAVWSSLLYFFFFPQVGNWQLYQEFTGKTLGFQLQAVNQETRMM